MGQDGRRGTGLRNFGKALLWMSGALTIGAAHAQVTQVEGSAGGGIVPWALLHPTAVASFTYVNTNDYSLQTLVVGGTIMNRVELSAAQERLNAPTVGNALSLDNSIRQNIFGAKVKLLDMGKDDYVPQVALGVQFKKATGQIVDALKNADAISDTSGTDVYLVASKVVSVGGRTLILNGALRGTKANQFGLLGFGGGSAGNDSYKAKIELSGGVFLADNVVLGGEYRDKPNNISSSVFGIKEEGAWDVWVAYFPNKAMSLTLAYANLGQVGPARSAVPAMASKQEGLYLQVQGNF